MMMSSLNGSGNHFLVCMVFFLRQRTWNTLPSPHISKVLDKDVHSFAYGVVNLTDQSNITDLCLPRPSIILVIRSKLDKFDPILQSQWHNYYPQGCL